LHARQRRIREREYQVEPTTLRDGSIDLDSEIAASAIAPFWLVLITRRRTLVRVSDGKGAWLRGR
jgi:hypothetical protein